MPFSVLFFIYSKLRTKKIFLFFSEISVIIFSTKYVFQNWWYFLILLMRKNHQLSKILLVEKIITKILKFLCLYCRKSKKHKIVCFSRISVIIFSTTDIFKKLGIFSYFKSAKKHPISKKISPRKNCYWNFEILKNIKKSWFHTNFLTKMFENFRDENVKKIWKCFFQNPEWISPILAMVVCWKHVFTRNPLFWFSYSKKHENSCFS